MSSLKQRYAELKRKNDAKQAVADEAIRQKAEAKQKAEQAKIDKQKAIAEAKKNDPKFIKQQERLKQKEEAKRQKIEQKEAKRLELIDGYITTIFNRLASDDDLTLKALSKENGQINQKVGGFNTTKEYLKTGFGFATRNMGEIELEQITTNKAFQAYKAQLDEQGFDVDVVKLNAGNSELSNIVKFACGAYATVCFAGTITLPPLGVLGLWAMNLASKSNNSTTNFTIQVKEKQSALALEDKRAEQAEASALINDINTQPEKEAVKQPII